MIDKDILGRVMDYMNGRDPEGSVDDDFRALDVDPDTVAAYMVPVSRQVMRTSMNIAAETEHGSQAEVMLLALCTMWTMAFEVGVRCERSRALLESL